MAYTGFVVEVKDIEKHNNADSLQLVHLISKRKDVRCRERNN